MVSSNSNRKKSSRKQNNQSVSSKSTKSVSHPGTKSVNAEYAGKSVMSGFDPSGSFLFVSNNAGKGWKVFDAVSNAVVLESKSTASAESNDILCFAWSPLSMPLEESSKKPKNNNKRKKTAFAAGKKSQYLAVGCRGGKTIVYDLISGNASKEIHSFKHESNESVLAVGWGSDCTLFGWFGCKSLVSWSVESGKKISSLSLASAMTESRNVTCLSLGSWEGVDYVLLAAGSIYLLNLESGLFEKKFIGHEGIIDQVCHVKDGLFVSKSKEDRSVLIWEKSSTNPVKVLTLDQPCLALEMFASGSKLENTIISCIDIMGSVYFYSSLMKESGDGISSDEANLTRISFEATSETAAKIPAFAVKILGSDCLATKATAQVVIARGNLLLPTQEKMIVELDGTVQVLKRSFDRNNLIIPTGSGNSMVEDIRKETLKYSESSSTFSSAVDLEMDLKSTELSMKDRLEALGISDPTGADETTLKSLAAKSDESSSKLPKSDSLCNMLMQALHTNDQSLLEQVLAVTDKRLVDNTVKNLKPSFVVCLLHQIVFRFQKRYKRGTSLYCWIKAILKLHASSLLSMPNLDKALRPLRKTVESRLSQYTSFLELSGRLDLVLDQINSRSAAQPKKGATEDDNSIGFLYHEGQELSVDKKDGMDLDLDSDSHSDEDNASEDDSFIEENEDDEEELDQIINISASEDEEEEDDEEEDEDEEDE